MTHLGTQIAALVDGQLAPAATERALCHVAGCPECAAELAAQRSARAVLAGAGQVPVAADLTARILALGAAAGAPCAAPDHPATRVRQSLGTLRQRVAAHTGAPVPMPPSRQERTVERLCLGARRRGGLPAWTVLAVVGVAAVWLFTAGEEDAVVPQRHPAQALTMLAAVDALAAQHAVAAVAVESVDDAAPVTEVPAGYEVLAVHETDDGVEVDLDGPYGAVVVTQQTGRLDPAAVAGVPVVQAGGHDVHVLSQSPWHVVWQSGDTVVSVVAGGESPAVDAVVSAFPATPFDDGLEAQISRGWAVVAGAWSP